jgi:hypothetical protein
MLIEFCFGDSKPIFFFFLIWWRRCLTIDARLPQQTTAGHANDHIDDEQNDGADNKVHAHVAPEHLAGDTGRLVAE